MLLVFPRISDQPDGFGNATAFCCTDNSGWRRWDPPLKKSVEWEKRARAGPKSPFLAVLTFIVVFLLMLDPQVTMAFKMV